MAAVTPGDTLSATNPVLDTFTATNSDLGEDPDARRGSVLADPLALAFQVFNTNDDAAPAAQVFPSTPGQRHDVDLVADKIGTGHFAAAWAVPGNQALGRYEIRWFVTQESGDAEREYRREFDVLANAPHGPTSGYCLVADVRDEGIAAATKNRRILDAILIASRLIDEWTGRSFVPTYKSIKIDGVHAAADILLEEPICAIESVTREGDTDPIDPSRYRVYARHLSQDLRHPDDRESPKIEFLRRFGYGLCTPAPGVIVHGRRGGHVHTQEFGIVGVFGYTDYEPGGSLLGVTPATIRRACVLLALRYLPKAASQPADAFDARNNNRVTMDRTREQTRQWRGPGAGETSQAAPLSGDPAIDELLLPYVRGLTGIGL